MSRAPLPRPFEDEVPLDDRGRLPRNYTGRRTVIEPGETYDEGKKGPWVKLTWDEAEALFAAAQSSIARGYRPGSLVAACSKIREQLEASDR